MSETKYILVLANSARVGKHCVAGKVATAFEGTNFDIGKDWIRLTDPRDKEEGAVPYTNTICPGHGSVRRLDLVKVTLQDRCNDADHPEDWHFDPASPWEYVATANSSCLSDIADAPPQLWHYTDDSKSVPAGYVRAMGAAAATLYLIKAPSGWTFTHWKEDNQFVQMPKTFRRLEFKYASTHHDFSVTDTAFTSRHKIFDKMQMYNHQTLPVPNPAGAFFCISLTKLSPKFSRYHYKICATLFET
jgi:hypothetical protein